MTVNSTFTSTIRLARVLISQTRLTHLRPQRLFVKSKLLQQILEMKNEL